MPTNAILLGAGLFVAAALGYVLARLTGRKASPRTRHTRALDPQYLRGLNYLLDEQPDKAIEIFIRMTEVNDETVETHFALASLFRRRGETERAIRIHQNLIARPGLDPELRHQALFALAEDYLSAGLLDRAERLFEQLTEIEGFRTAALEHLIGIYEQEREWPRAIDAQRQRARESGESRTEITAQYYCELAGEAWARGQLTEARQQLRNARRENRNGVRGLLMRAGIAQEAGDHALALKLLGRVVGTHGEFLPEAIRRIAACMKDCGREGELAKYLEALVARDPACASAVALTVITSGQIKVDATFKPLLWDYLRSDSPFRDLVDLLELGAIQGGLDDEALLLRTCQAVRKLGVGDPRYRCAACGFSGNTLYWQCPGCRAWGTVQPIADVRQHATDAATVAPVHLREAPG